MINPEEIPNYVLHAKPMTVGELKKKISNLPVNMPVFIVIDKISEEAWDEERECWRYALPLVYASRERVYGDEFGDRDEFNLLLEYESM